MNIIKAGHPQRGSLLAYSNPFVKKSDGMRHTRSVTNYNFISPHDALPLSCSYVNVQLVNVPVHKTAYFSNNLFFGIEDQCAYKLNDVICWKPCFNEGHDAIA
jgi:hypothetical protein